jgi:hypothetical protein
MAARSVKGDGRWADVIEPGIAMQPDIAGLFQKRRARKILLQQ